MWDSVIHGLEPSKVSYKLGHGACPGKERSDRLPTDACFFGTPRFQVLITEGLWGLYGYPTPQMRTTWTLKVSDSVVGSRLSPKPEGQASLICRNPEDRAPRS